MNKKEIANTMDDLTHGVYVIGVHTAEKDNLMTAAWLCQFSGSPAMIAVAVSAEHLTSNLIKEAGSFTVSILKSGQKETARVCGFVSGRKADKLALVNTKKTEDGIPFLKDAAAVMKCKVSYINSDFSHTLIIAEVLEAEYHSEDIMTYHAKEFFGK